MVKFFVNKFVISSYTRLLKGLISVNTLTGKEILQT